MREVRLNNGAGAALQSPAKQVSFFSATAQATGYMGWAWCICKGSMHCFPGGCAVEARKAHVCCIHTYPNTEPMGPTRSNSQREEGIQKSKGKWVASKPQQRLLAV